MSNPRPQGENEGSSSFVRSTCVKCGKKYDGECLTDMDGFYGCGKSDQKVRDDLILKVKRNDGKQALLAVKV